MLVNKIKARTSCKDKWECQQIWMREHKIPRSKGPKQTVLGNLLTPTGFVKSY